MLGAVKTAFVAIHASDVIVAIALGPIWPAEPPRRPPNR